jgi:hypothetical protein
VANHLFFLKSATTSAKIAKTKTKIVFSITALLPWVKAIVYSKYFIGERGT